MHIKQSKCQTVIADRARAHIYYHSRKRLSSSLLLCPGLKHALIMVTRHGAGFVCVVVLLIPGIQIFSELSPIMLNLLAARRGAAGCKIFISPNSQQYPGGVPHPLDNADQTSGSHLCPAGIPQFVIINQKKEYHHGNKNTGKDHPNAR